MQFMALVLDNNRVKLSVIVPGRSARSVLNRRLQETQWAVKKKVAIHSRENEAPIAYVNYGNRRCLPGKLLH